jgi:energy-coupling factor transport system permease protein
VRSPLAYVPRAGRLQEAAPAAAIAYLGSFVLAAFLLSNPITLLAATAGAALAGLLAGARRAVLASLRIGAVLALLIIVVNGIVTHRGDTVLARLGHWPLLGQIDITGEALAAGAGIGLRAMAAMVAFGVYSACVDPDRVLRLLRPLAARSALTATLVSRMVPLAARDAARLREAAALRGPAASEAGRTAIARRLLAGSLDRAVDVAATLELRGYGSSAPCRDCARQRSRHDRRFFAAAIAVALVVLVGRLAGADHYATYPGIRIAAGAETFAVAAALLAAGLAPLGPRHHRIRRPVKVEAARA